MVWKGWEEYVPKLPQSSMPRMPMRGGKPTRSKYGAEPTTVDGIRFASKAEAKRYMELKALEKAGEIKGLELQPAYPICVPVPGRLNVHQQVCTYIADFRYRLGPTGVLIVEDVKGVKTPVYRLKKKMVEAQYGIEIQEIR